MRTSLRSKKIQNYNSVKSDTLTDNLLFQKYYSNQSIVLKNENENIIVDTQLRLTNLKEYGTKNIFMGVDTPENRAAAYQNISLGRQAGGSENGTNNINIGQVAGSGQSSTAEFPRRADSINMNVGGEFEVGARSINIGKETTGRERTINIGPNCSDQASENSIHLGSRVADRSSLGAAKAGSIGIGVSSCTANQGAGAIGIGAQTASNNQGTNCLAIGFRAGYDRQITTALAIGSYAGEISQKQSSIAIGNNCGRTCQGENCIALGSTNIGSVNQGNSSIAIGSRSNAYQDQGVNSISIGNDTLINVINPTTDSFFIGNSNETSANTPPGVFVFNTDDLSFTPNGSGQTSGGLFINGCIQSEDIAGDTNSNGVMYYNPSSYEIKFNTTI